MMKDNNLMTKTMEKVSGMMSRTSKKFEQMGKVPYGMKETTQTEKRQMFEKMKGTIQNVRPEQWQQMIDEHGVDKVEQFLEQYLRETQRWQ